MGFFKGLRGTDHSEAAQAALETLKAGLPEGWEVTDFRNQLVGRRPVKLVTYGGVAHGPDGPVVVLGVDDVETVQALGRAVAGATRPTRTWAPPVIGVPGEHLRQPWKYTPESAEEAVARDEVLALLGSEAVLSPVDRERFGPVEVCGLTVHLPDETGISALSLDALTVHQALAERLRGELEPTTTWHVAPAQEPSYR